MFDIVRKGFTSRPLFLCLPWRHATVILLRKPWRAALTVARLALIVMAHDALVLVVENLAVLGPILVVLNILLIILGISLAVAVGLSPAEVKTIAVETGIQNGTLGIALGAIVGAQATGFSAYALPSAVYGITMLLVTVPIVMWLRSKQPGG